MQKHSLTIVATTFIVAMMFVGCGNEKATSTDVNSSARDAIRQSNPPLVENGTRDVGSANPIRILFFGDSITAGYGLPSEDQAFPSVFERLADEGGFEVAVTGAGNSGETTAGGLRRISWVLNTEFDVVVVELGGNDGLRGIPVPTTRSNLIKIVETIQEMQPDARIVIAGMRLPPSLGQTYVTEFEQVFADVAERFDLTLIPFILDGVAGDPALNQADGIHPTAEGHNVIADRVLKQLDGLLDEFQTARSS